MSVGGRCRALKLSLILLILYTEDSDSDKKHTPKSFDIEKEYYNYNACLVRRLVQKEEKK